MKTKTVRGPLHNFKKLNEIYQNVEEVRKRVNLAKENFIGVRSIYIKSVKMSGATLDGMVDQRDHFRFRLWRPI